MKHLALFENFEVVEPIKYGDPLNNKEINFLKGYNIMCPEWILKDDNYYYVFNHRCEIKDLPLTYIHAVCKKYNIVNYVINDYIVDVDGDVNFYSIQLTKIPLVFNIVSGNFDCSSNKLTTLEGSPQSVGGNFDCSFNQLTTLKGSPKEVGRDFKCNYNHLTTLEGGPKEVGGHFDCDSNKLITLLGSPKEVGGDFSCCNNKLTTLKGGPEYVGGDFYCYTNSLEITPLEYKGVIKGEFIYT